MTKLEPEACAESNAPTFWQLLRYHGFPRHPIRAFRLWRLRRRVREEVRARFKKEFDNFLRQPDMICRMIDETDEQFRARLLETKKAPQP
jgi:hypothetical protein